MIRSIARLFPKSCLTAFVMYPAILLLSSVPAFAGKVTITSPSTNASYPGTITVTATGSESVPFFYQLWDNGKKLGNVFSTSVNSSFTLPAGSHTLTVLTSTPSGRVLDSSSVVYQISSGSEYVWTAPKVGSVASLGTISYSSGSESAEVLSPKV